MEDAIKWLVGCDKYVKDKNGIIGRFHNYRFERGQLLYVDLFGHFSNEFTYAHPAIVLANGPSWVLIAPTSTKIYRDGNNYHIDLNGPVNGVGGDGVAENCGVMLENLRVISKNRIIKKFNKISNPSKLDLIDIKIIEYYTPKIHKDIKQKDKLIEKQSATLQQQEQQIIQINRQNEQLQRKISELQALNLLKDEEIYQLGYQITEFLRPEAK